MPVDATKDWTLADCRSGQPLAKHTHWTGFRMLPEGDGNLATLTLLIRLRVTQVDHKPKIGGED